MGTMNRMRENTGIILWILVISFGGLWVLQDSGVFDTIGSNPLGELIIVNGDAITLEEYNRLLESQLEQIRQATGEAVSPQMLESQRERTYSLLVDNKLRQQEMDRLGITVSDAEVRELILGENPHQIIRANFSDEDGEIDRVLVRDFFENPDQAATWLQIEEYIRVERRDVRFDELIASTARVSDADIEEAYERESLEVDVEYYLLRYAAVSDDSVSVTEDDLERFYDEFKDEDYQSARRYTIALASLSKAPFTEDTLAYIREAEMISSEFAVADGDSAFLAENLSESQYSDAFLGPTGMAPELAALLFEQDLPLEDGTIVGPVLAGGSVHVTKVTGVRPTENTYVRARHILVDGSDDASREEIRTLQDRLNGGEDFGDLAREASDDPGSGALGGDLGWFGDGQMVAPFQEAAFGATVGNVVGPVETDFGLHLIEVTHRAAQEIQIADYSATIRASVGTLTAQQERLEDLQYFAEESGDFTSEARRLNIPEQVMVMEEDQISIPGFGPSRSLARFLETSSVGDTGPVVELDEAFIMAHVTAIQPEGYQPFAEVRSTVESRALIETKKQYQADLMERAYAADGFDGVADVLGFTAQTVEGIGYVNQVAPSLGRDPVFAGTVLALDEGEDSGVVMGRSAVFVARVIQRAEPDPISDSDRLRIQRELQTELEGRLANEWISALRESADIVDKRSTMLVQ